MRATLVLLGILLLYGVASLLLPLVAVNRDWSRPPAGVEIAVLSNGVHTDIVLPVRHGTIDWMQRFPAREFEAVDASCAWIAFGWGSRDFYLETPTWADLRPSTALRALSGIGASAMHVSYHEGLPEGEACRRLRISEPQYRQLAAEVLERFVLGNDEQPQRIAAPGYSRCDRFYEAHGSYDVFETCNEWTGARLRSIGVRCGWWTPWAGDVLRYL